ncbi:ABC transporter permease family protein [Acetobacter persici]|uniref:hypothetical protein n=1 Tax=Acetobacter persici TaxID=1076596 RepID=UPI001BA9F184|nr:hypothetical protein [Acetobacter persici]MBS1016966.1 hypothetical protein [Acetobacter persici]
MTRHPGRATLAIWLIWRDLIAEKTMAFCLVTGLTATVTPLLLLAGLRAGIVEGMREHLLKDPHMSEVASASNRSFSLSWLKQMQQNPDVLFLIPKTRTLAASVTITPKGGDAFSSEDAELVGTAPGDPLPGRDAIKAEFPLVSPYADAASAPVPAIFSPVLASRMNVQVGDTVSMDVTRLGGASQRVQVPLVVRAISARSATDRKLVFVPLGVAEATEVYRESDPALSWDESVQKGLAREHTFFKPADPQQSPSSASIQPRTGEDSWPGFRMYASTLENVSILDKVLTGQRVTITDAAGQVEDVLRLDSQTRTLMMLLGVFSIGGFLMTLGSGIWASVERKQFMLATVRFLGVPFPELFPVLQAEFLAITSIALALSLANGAALVLNHLFENALPDHHPICLISWTLSLEASVLTALAALLAASIAAWKTSRLQPWDGVCSP